MSITSFCDGTSFIWAAQTMSSRLRGNQRNYAEHRSVKTAAFHTQSPES